MRGIMIALIAAVLWTDAAFAGMSIAVDGVNLPVEWESNESVEALKGIAPLTVKMSAYGGFEQVGRIGRSLPRDDVRITTEPGDIVLYSGNQIVIFYGSNTWEYTRLGHVIGKSEAELAEILGKNGVTLTISAD
ncbi:MAG: hypothetical protein IJG51_04525 [Synergistaceae bacterium]|nr:hypothetical protein [Synergistaceae bacterium]